MRNIHPQLICEARQLRWLTKFINTYYKEHICIVFIVKNITNTTNYSLNKRITSQENERKRKEQKKFLAQCCRVWVNDTHKDCSFLFHSTIFVFGVLTYEFYYSKVLYQSPYYLVQVPLMFLDFPGSIQAGKVGEHLVAWAHIWVGIFVSVCVRYVCVLVYGWTFWCQGSHSDLLAVV